MKKVKNLVVIFLIITAISTNLWSQENEKPYVILISFDGFRWDYVNKGITPNLKKMEMNGVSASSLRPVFPSKTFPNHYSIITGLYPENHGIIHNDFYDLFSQERYKVGDEKSVRNAKWYTGEAFWETAERQGITTASYFWPGSEVQLSYRHPTYVEYYEHDRPYEQRIEGVFNWLRLPPEERPRFITLYFDATDTYGHKHGPESEENAAAIRRLDDMLGLLFQKLEKIQLADKTNVIVVSDHGMTAVDSRRIIDIKKILRGFEFTLQGSGPIMMIDCAGPDISKIYQILKRNEKDYKVFLKADVPDYYHFSNHPFITPIVVIADVGTSLMKGTRENLYFKFLSKGNHGYDNHHLDMHGIFIATGPAFKRGYRTGTLWNIDVYPLLCKIFNIAPRGNIDGKLERIGFILKEY